MEKHAWFLIGKDPKFSQPAIGECSIIEGLSPDRLAHYTNVLDAVCSYLNDETESAPDLSAYPSIRFGLEMLLRDVEAKGSKALFSTPFTQGEEKMIINGLVWMGEIDFMRDQVLSLIERGFTCVKMKIGALDFEAELAMLKWIRSEFGSDLELRVDANGAFHPEEALSKLEQLATYTIHSIEQPIAPQQWEKMSSLMRSSPIPIALDEELIGIDAAHRVHLLDQIKPHYIILKPSLIGGWRDSADWIELANQKGIGWWITSALESNVGLNAIAQFVSQYPDLMPQGLGTGSLYTDNINSPLYLQGPNIAYDPTQNWNLSPLLS